MPRLLLSCIIAFFSLVAWFLGGSFFEVPGRNSGREIVAGGIALVLYVLLGQFWLPPDPTANTAEARCTAPKPASTPPASLQYRRFTSKMGAEMYSAC
jgi:hypothetical protein